VIKRISRRAIAIPVALMGLTALMVMSVPSAASAQVYYPLKNLGSGKCMTNGGSTANSAPITQYKCNGTGDQAWYYTGNTIVSLTNSKCLTNGGATGNNAPITQYKCNGSKNQAWFEVSSKGYFTIENTAGTLCMTTGGSKANSAPIKQYKCNGSNNQLWYNN
jgi:hypothetical protein